MNKGKKTAVTTDFSWTTLDAERSLPPPKTEFQNVLYRQPHHNQA
jgi:hypothetical protein